MRVVVDASVVVKWVLPGSDREPHTPQALRLLGGIREGSTEPIQPPHWLAEVAAVITRLQPEIAEPTLDLLDALDLPVASDLATYRRASRIAASLGHHLFDTLYHALAVERDAVLVTADERYFRKAHALGSIVLLPQWNVEAG